MKVSSINIILRNYKKTGKPMNRSNPGKARCTTARHGCLIVGKVAYNRHLSVAKLKAELSSDYLIDVPKDTIRRRLNEIEFKGNIGK